MLTARKIAFPYDAQGWGFRVDTWSSTFTLSKFRFESIGLARVQKATSHIRLRARDHHTSSNLIGGKGGADPSSLHTTLEGPTQ